MLAMRLSSRDFNSCIVKEKRLDELILLLGHKCGDCNALQVKILDIGSEIHKAVISISKINRYVLAQYKHGHACKVMLAERNAFRRPGMQ